MSEPTIIAVIVTHDRTETLAQSIRIIADQTLKVDEIIIVDNHPDNAVVEMLARFPGLKVTYLPSSTNLGGAGGFAYGILTALAKASGDTWVWLADDDGRPGETTTLETLYNCAVVNNLAEVSPLVVDILNPENLAFPLRLPGTSHWKRLASEITSASGAGAGTDDTGGGDYLPSIASLFNGALFRADTFTHIGVPDLRLFIRGDEVEIHRRLTRSGLKFGTCTKATYLHPNGSGEFYPTLLGKAHAQYPDNPTKQFYTYRNRGLLLAQPGMRKLRLQEWVRFTWFFLITRRDLGGYRNWRNLTKQGRDEKL